jgi:hypothetical protein
MAIGTALQFGLPEELRASFQDKLDKLNDGQKQDNALTTTTSKQ